MPSIRKPLIPLAPRPVNGLGLAPRDYEGEMSTLSAGCGHDSVTYFARGAHGFNSVHGRMAPIATGANAADRSHICIGGLPAPGGGEIATGLLFADEDAPDVHDLNATPEVPLVELPYERLCPGSAALEDLQAAFR